MYSDANTNEEDEDIEESNIQSVYVADMDQNEDTDEWFDGDVDEDGDPCTNAGESDEVEDDIDEMYY